MIHSRFSKSVIFVFLVAVISCVQGPQVKKMAELHYGDDETDVVETLGEGAEIVFITVNTSEFHYRFYKPMSTSHQYALLFRDGKLVGFSENKASFEACGDITADWEECFVSAISDTQIGAEAMEAHPFTNALNEEKQEESRLGGALVMAGVAATAYVVVAPVLFAADVLVSTAIVAEESAGRSVQCKTKEFRNLERRLVTLFPDSGLQQVIKTISDASPSLSEYGIKTIQEYDFSEGKRRVYGRWWACGRMSLVVLYGADNDHLVWMSKTLDPPSAQQQYAILLDRCPKAESGDVDAQAYIGDLYYHGAYGLETDMIQAYVWFSRAADKGNAYANRKVTLLASELTSSQ
jgi:hypothetical protein